LFLNSSFGTHSTISTNLPVPIFPLTTIGATLKWVANNHVSFSTALFDGCPTDFEKNAYNTKWKLDSKDGLLSVSEMQLNASLVNDLQGSYRFGFYYHNHLISSSDSGLDTVFTSNYGFYVSADQWVWQNKENETGIGVFAQLGISPEKHNTNQIYWGLGMNYKGLLFKRTNDVAGIAVAQARLHNAIYAHETTVELNYKAQLNSKIFIQPSFQYIVNPSGTDTKLDNVFAGTLRFGFEF
jgi:porin